ncbi:MAG: (2Fe-2S)-binding protein [Deltaproteobacteria bacterium]|nr:(2Fe-2S)-binding protein [Deltaproteobacteria bacterium]
MSNDPELTITWRLPDGSDLTGPGWHKLNLLAHADTHDLDLPQACGGHAECGTCRVRVLSGELTPVRHEEAELVRRHARRFRDRERLACQARPRSDCTIEILAIIPPDLRDLDDD